MTERTAAPVPIPRIVSVVEELWIVRFRGTSSNARAQKKRAKAAAAVTMADARCFLMTAIVCQKLIPRQLDNRGTEWRAGLVVGESSSL
jgi:hypothetical protein